MNVSPPLSHRVLAGLFGLLLGLSSLVCGGLVLMMVFRFGSDANGADAILVAAVGLFTGMTLVLAGSTSSLLVFAFAGRRGPLIHQGSLKVLLAILGTLLGMMFVGSLLSRDWSKALQLLGLGVELLGLFAAGIMFSRDREYTDG